MREEEIEAGNRIVLLSRMRTITLSNLLLFLFVSIFLLAFVNMGFLWELGTAAGWEPAWPWFWVNWVIVGVCLLFMLVMLVTPVFYRFQAFSAWVMSASWAVLAYSSVMAGATIASSGKWSWIQSPPWLLFGYLALVTVVGSVSTVYLWRRFRRMQRTGALLRDMEMGEKGQDNIKPTVFWIVVGTSPIAAAMANSESPVVTFFGLIFGLLFAAVIPHVAMIVGYLAYLRGKDRTYWEQAPVWPNWPAVWRVLRYPVWFFVGLIVLVLVVNVVCWVIPGCVAE